MAVRIKPYRQFFHGSFYFKLNICTDSLNKIFRKL